MSVDAAAEMRPEEFYNNESTCSSLMMKMTTDQRKRGTSGMQPTGG